MEKMEQLHDTNQVGGRTEAYNEGTSSSNSQPSIHTSLEKQSVPAISSTTNQPVNIPQDRITLETPLSGTTGVSQPALTTAYHSSTENASQMTPNYPDHYQNEPPPHDEAVIDNGNENKNVGSPQKVPQTTNTGNSMNETTPIKLPSSSLQAHSTPQTKDRDVGDSSKVSVTATSATVSGSNGTIQPTPLRNTKSTGSTGTAPPGTGNSNTTMSTPGPPPHPPAHSSFGWIPGASPPHPYHPYPIHHYHHPTMYGSPDTTWNKRPEPNNGSSNINSKSNGDTSTSTSGTSGNHLQSPPPPPPPPTMAPYGWPHHMGSYPYPPPPHPYPNGSNNRYPPMQPTHPHHYTWPPPMTLQPPVLHPQQRPPMNSSRSTATKGNSTGTTANRNGTKSNSSTAQSLNNKPSADAAMKSKLASVSRNNSTMPNSTNYLTDNMGYGYNHLNSNGIQAIQNNLSENRALSPTEIELNHRDEIQHMGCTCKKTKCLKLYCQCFGAKLYCGSNCRCMNCFNNRKHEKQRKEAMRNILSRNLSAFDTKFKKDSTIVIVEQPVTTNKIGQPIPSTTPPTHANPTASPVPPVEYTSVTEQNVEVKNSDFVTATPEAMHSSSAATLITSTEVARVLAHRLGCKCRKSACMKKYCECYAANVKCSASCRCMGCKNQGSGSAGGGNDYHESNMPLHHGMDLMSVAAQKAAHQAARQYHGLPQYPMTMNNQTLHNATTMRQYGIGMIDNNRNANSLTPQQSHGQQQSSSAQNNWNDPLSAAESLTFLKRGSPAKINGISAATHQPNRPYSMGVSPITKSPGTSGAVEHGTIPSLTSSSEGDSPGDAGLNNHLGVMSTPESYRGEDSALLIAAMAMTAFGQSPPPTSSMLSPETIQTYNTYNGGDEFDDGPGEINNGDSKATSQQPSSSKRSINFDDLRDTEKKNAKKKSKSYRWVS